MIRPTLDYDIANLQQRFIPIEDERHLTRNDEAVVDRFGAMHQRVWRVRLDR